jgi:hypothetical protein
VHSVFIHPSMAPQGGELPPPLSSRSLGEAILTPQLIKGFVYL